MGDLKSKKTLALLPVAILELFLLATMVYYTFNRGAVSTGLLGSIFDATLLVSFLIVAPATFFVIFFFLRKQPKPKLGVGKTILLVVVILVAELVLTLAMSLFVNLIAHGAPFAQSAEGAQGGSAEIQFSLIGVLSMTWQLFGEEAMKLSAFFLLYGAVSYKKGSSVRYWVAWLISSLLFGLLHLYTYGFDYLHCMVVIGLPVIIYGFLWMKTENPFLLWGGPPLVQSCAYRFILCFRRYVSLAFH